MWNIENVETRRLFIILLAAVAQLSACKESFEPKGLYEEKVVVFAILTTLSDTQYVRLYKTYNPSGFNPLEYTADNAIAGAQVSITDGSKVFPFRDTTIVRTDKSRYQTEIKAYVAYRFPVERGKTYSLSVQVEPGNVIRTELTVPPDATMRSDNFFILINPFAFNDAIDLKCFLSPLTRGYVVHTFVEYDLRVNNSWTTRREEIPLGIRNYVDCKNYDPVYPQLQRRKAGQPELSLYSVSSYLTTLKKIWNSNPFTDVRMKQVVFELTQFDRNLYDYFNIVNGFRDEFSIRTDEPDYSSIPGGLGIFGALTKQSLVVSIPETLGFNLGCQ